MPIIYKTDRVPFVNDAKEPCGHIVPGFPENHNTLKKMAVYGIKRSIHKKAYS